MMNLAGSLHGEATEALLADFRATRVSFTTWGTQRALDDDAKNQAASVFGANSAFLGASKKLVNTRNEAFSRVTSIKSRIANYWKDITLPYPEPGYRLIREDAVAAFVNRMDAWRIELLAAVDKLELAYLSLRTEAREQLADLYNESDYPLTLKGLFDVTYDFPNLTPPEYLRDLNPKLFEQQRARMVARFDEAIVMAEQAFMAEFQDLVSHIAERLTGTNTDGKAKQFKDSTVGNLLGFFDKFKSLNVHSSQKLDELVGQAQSLVQGIDPHDIKPDQGHTTPGQDVLRKHIANNMNAISEALGEMMTVKPKRAVVRPKDQVPAA